VPCSFRNDPGNLNRFRIGCQHRNLTGGYNLCCINNNFAGGGNGNELHAISFQPVNCTTTQWSSIVFPDFVTKGSR
jgi:hypothetical protein